MRSNREQRRRIEDNPLSYNSELLQIVSTNNVHSDYSYAKHFNGQKKFVEECQTWLRPQKIADERTQATIII